MKQSAFIKKGAGLLDHAPCLEKFRTLSTYEKN